MDGTHRISDKLDPVEGPESLIVDKLSRSQQRVYNRYPKAIDLHAKLLFALKQELLGSQTLTAGPHHVQHWREMLDGGESLQALDVSRLATEPCAECHAAVDAYLEVLARHRGMTLQPLGGSPRRGLSTEAAEVCFASGKLAEAVSEAMEDGAIYEGERQQCLTYLAQVKSELADVETALVRSGK